MAELIKEFFNRQGFRRFIILSVIALLLYLLRSLLNLILLTFIFTFLIYGAQHFLTSKLNHVIKISPKVVLLFLYSLIIAALVFGISRLSPIIAKESTQVFNHVINFYSQPHDNEIINYVINYINTMALEGYIKQGFDLLYKSITDLGKLGLNIIIALVLSMFFLLEAKSVIKFTSKFRESKIAPFYEEIAYFGKKFIHSFGKVLEAQFLIAFINCILSTFALFVMGFPNILILGIMVFALGLIPVAGVLISLIPLCLVAYSIGGLINVIYVLVMIAVLHALESYILNPKLMSTKTNLPVFYTFIILLASEHFFGVWGLIVGIPIFMFILDLLDVDNEPLRE